MLRSVGKLLRWLFRDRKGEEARAREHAERQHVKRVRALVEDLYEGSLRELRQARAREHWVGPGREGLHSWHRAAARGKNYGVGFCGGKQERERRAKGGNIHEYDARALASGR